MSDISEESDSFGYVAEAADDDGPDESDESGSDSGHGGLLDLEADESNGEDSEFDENDAEEELEFFPQFTRLPIELRYRIWEFFCPDLTAKGCVYSFVADYVHYHRHGDAQGVVISEGLYLAQQTRPARTMLAVYHESREHALKAFPDTLSFGDNGLLRFNSKRDIVLIDRFNDLFHHVTSMPSLDGFTENIRQLAIGTAELNDLHLARVGYPALYGAFQSLETLYAVVSPFDCKPKDLRWCFSEMANYYSLLVQEDLPIPSPDEYFVYCWPDLENHRDRAETELRGQIKLSKGVKLWPLVEYDRPLPDDFLEWTEEDFEVGTDVDYDSEGNVIRYSSEEDEYESSGIDDSDPGEDEPGYDSDDLAVLDDDDSNPDDENSGEGSHAQSDEEVHLTGDDHEGLARFSSPEQSSATLRPSDEPQDESDQPVTRLSRPKRPRGRVVTSDSEDDSDDSGGPRKRARTGGRRNPALLSSDDEEEEEAEEEVRKKRVDRAARAIAGDSDSERSEEEVEEDDSGTSQDEDEQAHRFGNNSSSEDDDKGSEGGIPISKPLSLAQKLQLHREKVPIPPSDDEDSEIEETGGEDYDIRDYGDFQDDEEDNETSGVDDEYDQGEPIMDGDDDEGDEY
ncbi:hypothetical protein C8A03DRAFT_38149 [Achaetomium macrosporum]|uniref:2EXR domain-containing protein n=1 Tax=Achaetomium macrosporum TaxID=79813 RepID=A0AAN7C2L3_9PEZI|nr:hypothetical protein C8A03DRAFT_38149 [Achaetomium macrosporum]